MFPELLVNLLMALLSLLTCLSADKKEWRQAHARFVDMTHKKGLGLSSKASRSMSPAGMCNWAPTSHCRTFIMLLLQPVFYLPLCMKLDSLSLRISCAFLSFFFLQETCKTVQSECRQPQLSQCFSAITPASGKEKKARGEPVEDL